MNRARAKIVGSVAAALVAAVAAVVGWWAAVVGLRWARLGVSGARFAVRLATLGAYRRCPACFRLRRREARVCATCGAPLAGR